MRAGAPVKESKRQGVISHRLNQQYSLEDESRQPVGLGLPHPHPHHVEDPGQRVLPYENGWLHLLHLASSAFPREAP